MTALERLSERQMALLVILFGLLLYIPFAGSYGLWDPWETHYAEVARQMTHRGDYISLWWPGSPRDGRLVRRRAARLTRPERGLAGSPSSWPSVIAALRAQRRSPARASAQTGSFAHHTDRS